MKGLVWRDATGETIEEVDVPADMADSARQRREAMIELLAEHDDALMEKYIHGEEVTAEEIKKSDQDCHRSDKAFPRLLRRGAEE
jgi:elongation factor G